MIRLTDTYLLGKSKVVRMPNESFSIERAIRRLSVNYQVSFIHQVPNVAYRLSVIINSYIVSN